MSKTFNNETEFVFAAYDTPYTIIENYICDNNKVEFNSQGLYLQIMRYRNSPTHKIYLNGLVGTGKGAISTVRRAIFNLRIEGFIERIELRNENGTLGGYQYKVPGVPVVLTIEDKLEIIKESKLNLNFGVEMYPELWPQLRDFYINSFDSTSESKIKKFNAKVEKLDKLNNINPLILEKVAILTEVSLTEVSRTDIGRTDTKKENGVKKKIFLKHNKSSSSVPSEKEEDEDEVITLYKDYRGIKRLNKIEKELLLELLSKHGKDKVVSAINVGVRKCNKPNFAYIETVCIKGTNISTTQNKSVQAKSDATRPIVNKNPYFTSTYSHNWDLDELEQKEREYINRPVYSHNPNCKTTKNRPSN